MNWTYTGVARQRRSPISMCLKIFCPHRSDRMSIHSQRDIFIIFFPAHRSVLAPPQVRTGTWRPPWAISSSWGRCMLGVCPTRIHRTGNRHWRITKTWRGWDGPYCTGRTTWSKVKPRCTRTSHLLRFTSVYKQGIRNACWCVRGRSLGCSVMTSQRASIGCKYQGRDVGVGA